MQTPLSVPAETRTRLPLMVAAENRADLRAPFTTHSFLSAGSFWARSISDAFLLRLNLDVVSDIASGDLRAALMVNGSPNEATNVQRNLTFGAGEHEPVSLVLQFFSRATFLTFGASLWLTTTVPVTVTPLSAYIRPESTAP
ncbi:hypothetical protein [Methylobacterium oryzisoli]|uniref:hypothetical protein n=1 Tax=Methylobacterium oryzisoli TaxID=3385502 RepID=UPI003892A812